MLIVCCDIPSLGDHRILDRGVADRECMCGREANWTVQTTRFKAKLVLNLKFLGFWGVVSGFWGILKLARARTQVLNSA